jgi:hypothetical protein
MTDALTHLTHFPTEGVEGRTYRGRKYRWCEGAHSESASGASVRQDATALADLARAVVRLCPGRRDPERFWQDKSDIAHALRSLARRLGDAP